MAVGNLMRRKGRTGLTILAIVLSGSLLTGISILSYSYMKSFEVGVSQMLGNTDIGVGRFLNISEGFFDETELVGALALDQMPGYINHTGRISFYQDFTTFEESIQRNAFTTTFMGIDTQRDRGFGYADFYNYSTDVGTPTTIEDVLSLNESFLVITTWVADVFNVSLNDDLMVLSLNTTRAGAGLIDPQNSSTWDRFFVKGIINDYGEGEIVSYNQIQQEPSHGLNNRVVYMNLPIARQVVNVSAGQCNQLLVGAELSKLSAAEDYVERHLPSVDFYVVNIKQDSLNAVRNSFESMLMILIIFTLISLIVAIMLITNTLLMNIQDQKYETSVLRAIGVYKSEVFSLFLSQAVFLAFIGSVIGMGVGAGLAPVLKNVFFAGTPQTASFNLRIYFRWEDFVLPLAITFGVTAFIGILPAYISTRLEIIATLRGVPPSKKPSKIRRILGPALYLVIVGVAYWYLLENQRVLINSLIGIIPFILALLAVTTIFIPILAKLVSYLVQWFLGSFRQLTERWFGEGENRKKANVTFMMFATSIAFLIMVSNVLVSVRNIQIAAIPRYLGGDVVLYSEGSTFGMDELLISDQTYIQGRVLNATVLSSLRVKINSFGTFASERKEEPRITTYIIEPKKFAATINEITLEQPAHSAQAVQEVFRRLDEEPFKIVITRQLADANHLNVVVGQNVSVNFQIIAPVQFEIVGIVDFVAAFSETWETASDITPVDENGRFAAWISWSTVSGYIDTLFPDLPDLHIAVKGNDLDNDFWDFPAFNATTFRALLQPYEANGTLTMAERVWDWNRTSLVIDPGITATDLQGMTEPEIEAISEAVHLAFENTTIKGQTKFVEKKSPAYESIQDALRDGVDQAVITKDIAEKLLLNVNDNISIWHQNLTWQSGDPPLTAIFRKNFTIAAIVDINGTLEAFNFDAMNPYVQGDNDVAADDTTAVIVDIGDVEFRRNILNTTEVYEFWLELSDYYEDHLRVNQEIQNLLGPDFVTMDAKWFYTAEFAYAPMWVVQLKDGVNQAEAMELIKEYLLAHEMPVIGWRTADDLKTQYSDQIEFQRSFFNVVLTFALLIAILGVMINMLMSVANRRREIGVLRAIGTQKGEVLKMIIGESFILTFTGLLLGAVVGTVCSDIMLNALPLDTVFRIWLTIDWRMIGIIAGVVILISILSSIFPAKNAMNVNVVEAIRSE